MLQHLGIQCTVIVLAVFQYLAEKFTVVDGVVLQHLRIKCTVGVSSISQPLGIQCTVVDPELNKNISCQS